MKQGALRFRQKSSQKSSVELKTHDQLNSIHAIKLTLNHFVRNNQSLDTATLKMLIDEVEALEQSIGESSHQCRLFEVSQLITFVQKFILNTKQEKSWKKRFSFSCEQISETASAKVLTVNIKQILRNLLTNFEESGALRASVKFVIGQSDLRVVYSSTYGGKIEGGLGEESMKTSMEKADGCFQRRIVGEMLVIEFIFPVLTDEN